MNDFKIKSSVNRINKGKENVWSVPLSPNYATKSLTWLLILTILITSTILPINADNDKDYIYTGLKVKTLWSGKQNKKINIVMVGDGYIEEDLVTDGKYEKDSQKLTDRFLKAKPFVKYKEYFNIYAVYAKSYNRGAEDYPGQDNKRNIFDSTVKISVTGKVERAFLDFQKPERILRVAQNATKKLDVICIMVNDNRDAGMGGKLDNGIPAPIFTTCEGFENTALHEFGHSFADLADEYVDYKNVGSLPLSGDLPYPNVTLVNVFNTTKTLKWRHFLSLP